MKYSRKLNQKNDEKQLNMDDEIKVTGFTHADVGHANNIWGEARFGINDRGHGFAAERANHLYDKLTGHNAIVLGDDNAKNGADRLVDGVQIQSKYCSSGSKCIGECFDKRTGEFRYYNKSGKPMQIEVPADKYEDAVRAMQEKIKQGKIKGIKDPNDAKKIVRKGHFTYEQAKNICKFGTVESITYDAINSAIVAGYASCLTFTLSFAVAIWNGKSVKEALRGAISAGIKTFGIAFVSGLIVGQLSKLGIPAMTAEFSKTVVNMIGPKASAALVNLCRTGPNIYGAAAQKSAAKILNNNIWVMAVTTIVLSASDISNVFRGRISGVQLFKNATNIAAGLGGGLAGASAGGSVGTTVGGFVGSAIPGVGTAVGATVGAKVGGLIGGMVGGTAAGAVSKKVLDEFIEDDAIEMTGIIEERFKILAVDYFLNQQEAEKSIDELRYELENSSKLLEMFASDDRNEYADDLLRPCIETIVRRRRKVKLPSNSQTMNEIRFMLEQSGAV